MVKTPRRALFLSIAILATLAIGIVPAAADLGDSSSSGWHRVSTRGSLGGASYGRSSVDRDGRDYRDGDYLVVEDDAELGEILLFDIVARISDMDIREVLDIHDIWDLYPEEVATALFLRELTGGSYAAIATLRADEYMSWKGIAYEYNVEPDLLGEYPSWYRTRDRDDWWEDDPDIEHRIVIAMLSTDYGWDEDDLDRLSRDGLGYSDMAVMLELSYRSGRDAIDLLDRKMERRIRWRTLADELDIDLGDLDYLRSLHYHNGDFEGYYPWDEHRYHPNRRTREHRSRREYHHYGDWRLDDNDYYVFDYVVDYDYYWPWGRCYYTYWWPHDCWWDRVRWGYHWPSNRYHDYYDPHYYRAHWEPRDPYWNDWRRDPWITSDPPRERDSRRYAERIHERYGDVAYDNGEWRTRTRVSSAGVTTVRRGERGDSRASSGSSGSSSRGGSTASRGTAPPPNTSSRSGSTRGSDRSSSRASSGGGSSSSSGRTSRTSSGGGSRKGGGSSSTSSGGGSSTRERTSSSGGGSSSSRERTSSGGGSRSSSGGGRSSSGGGASSSGGGGGSSSGGGSGGGGGGGSRKGRR